VALLRASGFPTRYVRGVIEFFPDIERAKHLTGIADERELAAFFQRAGIPYTTVIAGGRIAAIRIEHIFVETFMPYANYRGDIIDEHGKVWLALDTSIKVRGYDYNEPLPLPDDLPLAGIRDGPGLKGRLLISSGSRKINNTPSPLNPVTPLPQSRFILHTNGVNAILRHGIISAAPGIRVKSQK